MIITIIGARPQFIKAAVLSKQLMKHNMEELIIHTGQHYDYKMSEVFFSELGLKGADINLNIGSSSHAKQTAAMLEGIENILVMNMRRISKVVVFGDTNSTLAGALAASKLDIPIVHVEAGLRSYNRKMPEEINRIVTDHLSSLLFCSSEIGKLNLKREGITEGVHVCGDIMLDAFDFYMEIALSKKHIDEIVPKAIADNFVLVTIHRPVNTDEQHLDSVIKALGSLPCNIVWPVHPRTKKAIEGMTLPDNIFACQPLSYFEMMVVLGRCNKVITDSGGLQKEAYWAKKPCITIRSETEWKETIHNNWNILVQLDNSSIMEAFNTKVDAATWVPLYGAGDAAKQIATVICN